MPKNKRSTQSKPSLGAERFALSFEAKVSNKETRLEVVIRENGLYKSWDNFVFPPGPEKPLWPAELCTWLSQVTAFFTEYSAADRAGRNALLADYPKFYAAETQGVLPF